MNLCIFLIYLLHIYLQTTFTFNVPHTATPDKLLELILTKRANFYNNKNERASDFILKVCGQDEFLIGNYHILQFQYIQDAISRDVVPVVVPITKNQVPSK